MTRARVAWVVAILDISAFVVASIVSPSDLSVVLYLAGIALFGGIGALLIARVPGNAVGLLMLAVATSLTAAIVIGSYASAGITHDPPWPGTALARALGDALWIVPIVIAIIGIPLVFPDGRLPSPRYRWIVRLTVAYLVIWIIEAVYHFGPDEPASDGDAVASVLAALEIFILIATLISFLAAIVAVWQRFRRGSSVERQQVKWLVAVVVVGAVVFPASFVIKDPVVANILSIIGIFAFFGLPAVIGMAILRYRLYEIDRIISRTVGYGIVTALLGAVLVASILLLQAALQRFTGGQTVAVAASTLVVFALFQPLRRRVQTAVDRRFDRARYDAERTAEAFAGRLRAETDMSAVTSDLAATTKATVAPRSLSIWLRPNRVRE